MKYIKMENITLLMYNINDETNLLFLAIDKNRLGGKYV